MFVKAVFVKAVFVKAVFVEGVFVMIDWLIGRDDVCKMRIPASLSLSFSLSQQLL